MCQGRYLLGTQGLLVNANIVNKAGEERAGGVILPDTDVQTTGGSCQVALRVFGHHDTVNTGRSLRTVPHQTYAVPLPICDDCLSQQCSGTSAGPFRNVRAMVFRKVPLVFDNRSLFQVVVFSEIQSTDGIFTRDITSRKLPDYQPKFQRICLL